MDRCGSPCDTRLRATLFPGWHRPQASEVWRIRRKKKMRKEEERKKRTEGRGIVVLFEI